MSMRLFVDVFKELVDETRVVQLLKKDSFGSLPVDAYAFWEFYCDEKNCDCRRVMISIIGQNAGTVLATINMGFDSEKDDAGPFLDYLNVQSEHSNDLLKLFLDVVNSDADYVTRLQRHYVMFKEKIERKKYKGRPFETPGKTERKENFPEMPILPASGPAPSSRLRVGRNAPCPCGSGKKYKKCCMNKPQGDESKTAEARTTGAAWEAEERKAKAIAGDLAGKMDIEEAEALVKSAVRHMQRKTEQHIINRHVGERIKENPLIAFPLLRLLLNTYAPDGTVREMSQSYQACLSLLEDALTEIRYSIERDQPWAMDAARSIQEEIAAEAFRVEVDTRVQADLVRAIYEAKLELHPEIKSKSEELARYYGRFITHKGIPNLDRLFDEMASAGPNNPFELMEHLMSELNLLPVEGQLATVAEMARARNPLMRELAALMLLHPNHEVRVHVSSIFIELVSPKAVGPVSLRRMIGLRNWLPDAERPALDKLIKSLRAAHVECAPMPPVQRFKTFASSFDGAGAQGILNFTGQKRKHQLVSVLVKQGWGIRDTMGLDHLDKKDVESIIGDMGRQTPMSELIDRSYMERVVSHFLWVGLQQGNPPQAGLLQVAEVMGIAYWSPRRIVGEEEIAILEEAMDPRFLTSENIARVMEQSRNWPARKRFASVWFEDDARVDNLLRSMPGISSTLNVEMLEEASELILEEIIEKKYDIWAERLLLMTWWAKACKSRSPLPWEDFFIVARQFQQGVPPKGIPLLIGAAERSVHSGLKRMGTRLGR